MTSCSSSIFSMIPPKDARVEDEQLAGLCHGGGAARSLIMSEGCRSTLREKHSKN
jgi:hypothetical protein